MFTKIQKLSKSDLQPEDKRPARPKKPAHALSPAERSRWCLAHELTRLGYRCPFKRKLDGCVLWAAIKAKRLLPPLKEETHAHD